jgi:hypothetical protein
MSNNKEGTELLISLGGRAVLATVRTNWPDNNEVQTQFQILTELIAVEMTISQPAVRRINDDSESEVELVRLCIAVCVCVSMARCAHAID